MTFQEVVWRERDQLIQTAHFSIVHGMLDTWRRCARDNHTPQEPDFVAGLVLEATPLLYSSYNALFSSYAISFSLTSVFCHQTPKIRYDGMAKSSCEVGDLLLVHVHAARSGMTTRNALLYQAKVSAQQPHHVSQAETDQLRLYTDWPRFEYYRSSPLKGYRDIFPKARHLGAQYLLIDNRPPNEPASGLLGLRGTYPIGSCMADQYLHDHSDLATEMHGFLQLRSGKAFANRNLAPSDGWSELVWDLLSAGLNKAFNRKRSGRSRAPRAAGAPLAFQDGCCFAQATTAMATSAAREVLGPHAASLYDSGDRDRVPPEEANVVDEEIPGSGCSVILIETSEIEG